MKSKGAKKNMGQTELNVIDVVKTGRIRCTICKYCHLNVEIIRNHMKLIHYVTFSKLVYKCLKCGINTVSFGHFRKHLDSKEHMNAFQTHEKAMPCHSTLKKPHTTKIQDRRQIKDRRHVNTTNYRKLAEAGEHKRRRENNRKVDQSQNEREENLGKVKRKEMVVEISDDEMDKVKDERVIVIDENDDEVKDKIIVIESESEELWEEKQKQEIISMSDKTDTDTETDTETDTKSNKDTLLTYKNICVKKKQSMNNKIFDPTKWKHKKFKRILALSDETEEGEECDDGKLTTNIKSNQDTQEEIQAQIETTGMDIQDNFSDTTCPWSETPESLEGSNPDGSSAGSTTSDTEILTSLDDTESEHSEGNETQGLVPTRNEPEESLEHFTEHAEVKNSEFQEASIESNQQTHIVGEFTTIPINCSLSEGNTEVLLASPPCPVQSTMSPEAQQEISPFKFDGVNLDPLAQTEVSGYEKVYQYLSDLDVGFDTAIDSKSTDKIPLQEASISSSTFCQDSTMTKYYKCSVCLIKPRFTSLDELQRHTHECHVTTSSIPFRCKKCQEKFLKLTDIQQHMQIHD